jgi:transposase
MAGAYSTDLRSRVLAAVDAGAAPEAAARRFAVGRSTAYRWVAAARDEGRRAAKRLGGGPKPWRSAGTAWRRRPGFGSICGRSVGRCAA